MAAYLAQDGFTGAQDIFTGPQGLAAGMSTDANPAKLTDGLGTRWTAAETSFKCTPPAATPTPRPTRCSR